MGSIEEVKKTQASPVDVESQVELDLKIEDFDYKNVALIKRFMTSVGRVLSRRATGLSAKKQRKMAKEVRKMKFLALVPYCDRHK
ncbi:MULTISPECIES: 30S ribosomal protein S18 [Neorickettsia]|uniref:Small ribosomal subunit protein bS18 n=1 Tax=Neorickettsia findlayensis TaxID=2686014 RepID=A0A6P1G9J2_9RICK|nr:MULTISPECIES: 30S ribosomal protein S18 [Neorickettsia]KYH12257.1 30S ribosomal protein S18 [Neorickettsia sp. 179522]QHD64913.1 30S ribosomal protein S18 [Neorickettsia findlayensis]